MNSENENNNEFNEDYYKAMAGLSLSQLEDRARQAGCKLEIEFNITQGQSGDDETFQEGGAFIATYIPNEDFRHQVMWPSEKDNYSINVHLNGVSEEDFQEYDKIAGDIDLSGVSAHDLTASLTADIELKAEILSTLQEKHDIDILEAIMNDMDENWYGYCDEMEEMARAIDAFDKAKIDPEAF